MSDYVARAVTVQMFRANTGELFFTEAAAKLRDAEIDLSQLLKNHGAEVWDQDSVTKFIMDNAMRLHRITNIMQSRGMALVLEVEAASAKAARA